MTDEPMTLANSAQGKLRSLVERIERLNEDRAAVQTDIKEVFAEAKGEGFDVKILRRVIALRARDAAAIQEEKALLELYMGAIQGDLFEPQGGAAMEARAEPDGLVTVKERGNMKPSKGALSRQAKADARAQAEAAAKARRRVINLTVAHDGWCLALHGGPCSCRPLVSSDAIIEPAPTPALRPTYARDAEKAAKYGPARGPLFWSAKEGRR